MRSIQLTQTTINIQAQAILQCQAIYTQGQAILGQLQQLIILHNMGSEIYTQQITPYTPNNQPYTPNKLRLYTQQITQYTHKN